MPTKPANIVGLPPQGTKKVIFADFNPAKFDTVADWLKKDAINVERAGDVPTLLERINKEKFDVCVVNLMLGGIGPFELITQIRQQSTAADLRIVVVSMQVHKLNIHNTIEAGAHDFIAEPFEDENIYQRVLYHLTPKRVVETKNYSPSSRLDVTPDILRLLVESIETLSACSRAKAHEAIHGVLTRIARAMDSNRTSLIIVDPEVDTGVVIATSDDAKFTDFPISLHNYPEILHVIHSDNFVLIEDVQRNALTHNLRDKVKSISIGSLMVFPVRYHGEVTGVLIVRRSKAREVPAAAVMRVLQAVANTLAAHANIKAVLRRIYKEFAA